MENTVNTTQEFIINSMSDWKGAARLENEDFATYKARRKAEDKYVKSTKKGNMVWVATSWQEDKESGLFFNQGGGTYNKSIHGEI